MVATLPADCINNILLYLPPKDTAHLAQTCRRMRNCIYGSENACKSAFTAITSLSFFTLHGHPYAWRAVYEIDIESPTIQQIHQAIQAVFPHQELSIKECIENYIGREQSTLRIFSETPTQMLKSAISLGVWSKIPEIIQSMPRENRESKLNDAYQEASLKNSVESCLMLLRQGLRINRTSIEAIFQQGSMQSIRLLIASGIDIHRLGPHNSSLLDYPIYLFNWECPKQDRKEIISLLLEIGLDLNGRGQNGYSLLGIAVRTANISLVQFLVSRKVNLHSQDEHGRTTLHMLFHYFPQSIPSEAIEVMRYLLEQGMNPEAKDINNLSPLDLAKWHPELRSIEPLNRLINYD